MSSERIKIYNYLTRLSLKDESSELIEFDKIFFNAIDSVFNISEYEKELYIEKNINRIWSYVSSRQYNDFNNKQVEPIFHIVDQKRKLIQCNIIYKLNKEKNKRPFYRLLSRPYILQEIDKLTHREYEALSALVCNLIGASKVYLTPCGNEGGVDFVALIPFSNSAHYLFGTNGPIKIIGQCKKYNLPVSVNTIKEFNSTLNDVYSRTSKMLEVLPSWFFQEKGIILGWIIAHSGFQNGAMSRAKDYGLILSDSIDIAQLVSKSSKFHANKHYNKRHQNLKEDINIFINKI